MADQRSFKLRTGVTIPAVGFGTWKSTPEDTYSSVKFALQSGYRHIDTAWIYGNEEDAGRAIRDSGVPRSELFLTTKLWCTYHTRVQENLDDSLRKLGVDYLDLWLMHWPVALVPDGEPPNFPVRPDGSRSLQDRDFRDTWADMVKVLKAGKVKAIGVANFDVHNLKLLKASSEEVPVVNQVEIHPYLQNRALREYAEREGIHVTAYSPLGSTDSAIHKEQLILDIAKAHGVDIGPVLLSWGIKSGHSVITKSVKESRITGNFVPIELTEDEMAKINTLDRGGRISSPPWGVTVFHDE